MPVNRLLPPDALRGQRVALSVSNTPDLAWLGLLGDHFDLALGEVARTVLTAGGTLAYGGYLEADGRTAFLVSELSRWQRTTHAITLYLPWSVHRPATLAALRSFRKQLGRLGTVEYLDAQGRPIVDYMASRPEAGEQVPAVETQSGLTGMRRRVTDLTSARVLLGGKRSGFTGRYPGLVEEALFSLEKSRPVFLAGGFGGVTLDIVRAVDSQAADWLPSWPGAPEPEERFVQGIQAVAELASDGWSRLANGLTPAENCRLAVTPRPSEIAALIGLGIGRLAAREPTDPQTGSAR